MFHKTDKEDNGRLYLIWFKLRDVGLVWKIGVTTKEEPVDRLLQILRSFFMNKNYRYIPECYIKRFKMTSEVYKKEADMHAHFKPFQYVPEHKFDGSTEMFIGLDEEYLLSIYDKCLAGEDVRNMEISSVLEYG